MNNGLYPTYLEDFIKRNDIVPGEGHALATDVGYYHETGTGYISYSAPKYFEVELGHGKHFWGDGYRSLLLSDATNNYSYLRMSTTIWRIKYVNLFTNMKDIRGTDGTFWKFRNKYGTAHFLSINATKWLNVGLFESVIWQAHDTLNGRGYDINYLNPVIFYRPVEYAVGSSDNSVLGLNVRVSPCNAIQLYHQLVLDEFLLSEIRAQNGWWGIDRCSQNRSN